MIFLCEVILNFTIKGVPNPLKMIVYVVRKILTLVYPATILSELKIPPID